MVKAHSRAKDVRERRPSPDDASRRGPITSLPEEHTMARFSALAVSSSGGIPQDLDLDTVELFSHFFNAEELIGELRVLELSSRELTMLKAVLLQELARQIARQNTIREAVRERCRTISGIMRPSSP
jgi:hypothetical protein